MSESAVKDSLRRAVKSSRDGVADSVTGIDAPGYVGGAGRRLVLK
jgi:hypothetical protein